ncbi:hypothetical protein I656_01019 [Geobacillus sp. WSUCF1]|nr:hypothetical protein I656_01019 [Geobacillus sp. WSUCF1]
MQKEAGKAGRVTDGLDRLLWLNREAWEHCTFSASRGKKKADMRVFIVLYVIDYKECV